MGDTVIHVENLSKKYVLSHQQDQDSHKTLRDEIAAGATALLKPLTQNSKLKTQTSSKEEFWALKDVSFEIKQGDRVGIIGRNGAGKSTLLKILSRIVEPTNGRIRIKGRVASLLEVGTGFHPELTGRENIFLNGAILGMSKAEIQRKFDEIVAFAEIDKFLDTPVKRYSSGMYVRLAFAVAAHLEPEILIVDEVLAVGDISFQEKCLGKMQEVSSGGRTVLFVSHNIDSIRALCTSGIYLRSGTIESFDSIENVTSAYLCQFTTSGTGNVIHFSNKSKTEFYIDRIEILDINGASKELIQTWDYVKFRIFFYCSHSLNSGSVVFQISTLSGTVITLCSTEPDSNFPTKFKAGINQIDCIFPKLMLSAGKYLIGAGLAVPNAEWLCNELESGVLSVLPQDVFGSGLSPSNSRYLIPQPHFWNMQEDLALSTSGVEE